MHNQTPTPPIPQVQAAGLAQTQQSALAVAATASGASGGLAQQPRAAAAVHNVQTTEMNIPNDLIGCIIGRGGQKISEIRQAIFFYFSSSSQTNTPK